MKIYSPPTTTIASAIEEIIAETGLSKEFVVI